MEMLHPTSFASCILMLVLVVTELGNFSQLAQAYKLAIALVNTGKSAPSVAEQPFVLETCNFGHICTVT